jgi:hypothetical protein
MKNSLRNIIREQIERLFEADSLNPAEDAINDIQAQVADTQKYLEDLEKETKNQIKTDQKLLNLDRQSRSSSPTTITVAGEVLANPKRKGLDQELPAKDKVIKARQDGLKKIETAKKNYQKMADNLEKKEIEIAKSQKEAETKNSILPSLQSPI